MTPSHQLDYHLITDILHFQIESANFAARAARARGATVDAGQVTAHLFGALSLWDMTTSHRQPVGDAMYLAWRIERIHQQLQESRP